MTVRKITFSLDEFYHLYSRGVDKRLIFLDDDDRNRFVRLLYLCNGTKPLNYRDTMGLKLSDIDTGDKLVGVGAYCLMPNHFHLLIKEVNEGGIVKFMSKLLTAYSSYFNRKYERVGALFGSEFKSEHANDDTYLRYLFAYIHLNPVKLIDSDWRTRQIDTEVIKSFLKRYQYSSFLDYIDDGREERLILNKQSFPTYFADSSDFLAQMHEWLSTDFPRALPSVKIQS